MFGFVKKAVHAVGHAASDATKAATSAVGHVPIVGAGLHGALSIALEPVNVATAIATGRRIDRAVFDSLKRSIADVREVAPYVQMVVSNVPGIGTGISGALAGGLALASGAPITEALIAATKAAVPGGPLAQAAFSLGAAAVQGKPLDSAALAALPVDDATRKAIATGLATAKSLAHGRSLDATLMNAAHAALPPEAQKALTVGMALAHGQTLQAAKSVIGAAASQAGEKGMSLLSSLTKPVLKAAVNGGASLSVPLHPAAVVDAQKIAGKLVAAAQGGPAGTVAAAKRTIANTVAAAAAGDPGAKRAVAVLNQAAKKAKPKPKAKPALGPGWHVDRKGRITQVT